MSGAMRAVRAAQAREFIGMTIEEVASATGIPVAHLTAIEAGSRMPDQSELDRLAQAYGLSTAYFTEPDGVRRKESITVLGRLAGELSGEDRAEALQMAAYLRHVVD